MDVIATDIPDVRIVVPVRHGDARGFLSETWSRPRLREHGIDVDFVQDNHSRSAAVNTIRALHFQKPPAAQAKLVRVVRGAILDVAVDLRRGSPWFGRHVTVELSAENWKQLYVPAGFAHGFRTLEPDTEVLYKVSSGYAPELDAGVLWNDEAIGIDWGVQPGDAVLSEKDRRLPTLGSIESPFDYELAVPQ